MIRIGIMLFAMGSFAPLGYGFFGLHPKKNAPEEERIEQEGASTQAKRKKKPALNEHDTSAHHVVDSDKHFKNMREDETGSPVPAHSTSPEHKESKLSQIKEALKAPFKKGKMYTQDAAKGSSKKVFQPVLTQEQVLLELKRLNVNVRITDQEGNLIYGPEKEKPSMISWLLKHCRAFGWGIETKISQRFSDPSGSLQGYWYHKQFHQTSPQAFQDSSNPIRDETLKNPNQNRSDAFVKPKSSEANRLEDKTAEDRKRTWAAEEKELNQE